MSRGAGFAALFVATGVLFLARLDHSPLLEPDEGRYAELAREMIASGDGRVLVTNAPLGVRPSP